TAVGKYIQYWCHDVTTWATAAAFFVLIKAINLAKVKALGETEFWIAIIKVAAIVGMILLGIYLLVGGGDTHQLQPPEGEHDDRQGHHQAAETVGEEAAAVPQVAHRGLRSATAADQQV
ncbi:amino acid permease, partial [Pseudomonas aeruginosa]